MKSLMGARRLLMAAAVGWMTVGFAGCATPAETAARDDAYRPGDVTPATGSQVVRRDRTRNDSVRQADKDNIEVGRTMPAAKPGT